MKSITTNQTKLKKYIKQLFVGENKISKKLDVLPPNNVLFVDEINFSSG